MFTLDQRHKLQNENPRQIHEHGWGRHGLLLPVGRDHLLLEKLDLNSSEKCEAGDGCHGLLAFSPAPSMNINVMKWTLRVGNTLRSGLGPLRSKHDAAPRTERSSLFGSGSWTKQVRYPWSMYERCGPQKTIICYVKDLVEKAARGHHLISQRNYSLPSINVNPREWIKVNIYRGVNN